MDSVGPSSTSAKLLDSVVQDPPAELVNRFSLSDNDWRKVQMADPQIHDISDSIKRGDRPSATRLAPRLLIDDTSRIGIICFSAMASSTERQHSRDEK